MARGFGNGVVGNHDRRLNLAFGGQAGGQVQPDFLGDEGHEGVQQTQGPLQYMGQHRPGRRTFAGTHAHLGHLDVPVTEVVPDEIVELLLRLTQFEGRQGAVHVSGNPVQQADNPAVFPVFQVWQVPPARQVVLTLQGSNNKAGGVPDLVGEVAGGLQLALGDAKVIARGGAGGQGEPESVGAVAVDEVQGVHGVAPGLAHFVAVGVANKAVEVHGAEGDIPGILDAHHDHAGHPEKQDIVARFHDGGGVEIVEVVGGVGPAKGGMGPQAGAEPGIQHVLVLPQPFRVAGGTGVGVFGGNDNLAALVAVPDGDAVAPP